jgi:hypothetical protein
MDGGNGAFCATVVPDPGKSQRKSGRAANTDGVTAGRNDC